MLGGTWSNGMIRAFDGHEPKNDGTDDYSFMTPEDIKARKALERLKRIDERDVNIRNSAHYRAYSALRWIVPAGLFLLIAEPYRRHPFLVPAIYVLLLLVVSGLPQSILLWTEPDMEPADEGSAEVQA
jgi:hypothetical protein